MNKKLKYLVVKIIYFLTLAAPGIRKKLRQSERYGNRLTFFGTFKTESKFSKSFYLTNNAFTIETDIYWNGFDDLDWENATRKIWIHLAKNANTILDIGANTGVFSVVASANNPRAKIIAFEPQPNIFQALHNNNNVNEFSIICENLALSNVEGELPFFNYGKDTFESENTTAGSLNSYWRKDDQHSIVVQVDTLSKYIEKTKIEKIDLIKIDVETLEYEVLDGYRPHIMVHKPIIILEIQTEEIGRNIMGIFEGQLYVFFNIDENLGLIEVNRLGTAGDFNNYVLCPVSKQERLEKFIAKKK